MLPLAAVLAGLALLVLLVQGLDDSTGPPSSGAAPLSLESLLGDPDTEGYARARAVRPFRFPQDHGPHPAYRSEWWYFTGNLEDAGGRHFGYQWTVFRFALRPDAGERASAWAARQVYMGHFTVTDVDGEHFYSFERLTREALGLAGAQAAPFRVWIEDWSVAANEATGGWRLQAAAPAVDIDLELEPLKPVVLQGDRGLSRKSATPGNASYYYSVPRLATRGTLTLGDRQYAVHGSSWLDREWSTSALDAGQVGWDWFGLQLADETELMFYRLRRRDGSVDPHSGGSFVDAQDHTQRLAADEVELTVLETWDSPRGGRYPARWRLQVPSLELDLDIRPLLADQELDLSVRYWEGAVRITGHRAGQPVAGYGYAELTGYTPASGKMAAGQ
jgi:predicted secreted hydrolase